MAQRMKIDDIVERTRREILFAIKERVTEVTEDTGMPVRLGRITVSGDASPRESVSYYEVNNIYLDERRRLCGDLAGRGERLGQEVLFGRDIEDLCIDDLKLILDALYGRGWGVDLAGMEAPARRGRGGLFGFFSSRHHGAPRAAF